MAEEPGKSNHLLLITTIITVAGAIIAAIITVSGNIKVEKIRQDAELSRGASQPTNAPQPTSVPLPIQTPQPEPTTVTISITLTNYNCYPQEYYVDNIKMASIPAGETIVFDTVPGPHQVRACTTGSTTCGDPVQIVWEVSTTAVIHPHPSCNLATITLTNNHCQPVDYYVDNTLMVSSIAAYASAQFSVVPGSHQVYVCDPGTSICGGTVELTWNTSTTAGILKGPDCP